jgi:phospholipid transport system substrate-binding protein
MKPLVLVVTLGVLLAGGEPALAGAPTDQLKQATDQILKLLEGPTLKGPDQLAERRQQIRAIASDTFDWRETAKRVLGRHWTERTPQEREEFGALFIDFIEHSYVGKLELYSGERILYIAELTDGPQVTVRTKLITKSNTEVPVDYRMLKDGERWRVYDVVIEGVSLVSSYRTQFTRIIQQSGYSELVKKLRTKQDELAPENSQRAKKQS